MLISGKALRQDLWLLRDYVIAESRYCYAVHAVCGAESDVQFHTGERF